MIPGTAWCDPPQNKYKLQTKKEQKTSLILERIRLWWNVFSGPHGPSCYVGLQPCLNTCIRCSTLCYKQTQTRVYFILLETTSLAFCRQSYVHFMYVYWVEKNLNKLMIMQPSIKCSHYVETLGRSMGHTSTSQIAFLVMEMLDSVSFDRETIKEWSSNWNPPLHCTGKQPAPVECLWSCTLWQCLESAIPPSTPWGCRDRPKVFWGDQKWNSDLTVKKFSPGKISLQSVLLSFWTQTPQRQSPGTVGEKHRLQWVPYANIHIRKVTMNWPRPRTMFP